MVFQQLSGKAAGTIHGRVCDVIGGTMSPEALSATDDAALLGAGLSNGLRTLPDAKRLERPARPWPPYRSVASWYCWRLLDIQTV